MLKSQEEIAVTQQLQDQFPSFFFAPTQRFTQSHDVRQRWQKRFEALQQQVIHMSREKHRFNFSSVVVGGTSGKGSTVHLLASVLAQSGKRVGVFISPHLQSLQERFEILNSDPQIENQFWSFIQERSRELKSCYKDLSFFEALFLLAGQWFSHCECDGVVWEAGCGGRWDATNALVHKRLVILTNVELDHQELLGSTRQAIATEKAPLLSHSEACVIGERDQEIRSILEQQQRYWSSTLLTDTYEDLDVKGDIGGRVILEDRQSDRCIETQLYGEGQQDNVRGVAIASKFLGMSRDHFCDALDHVQISGRIERLQKRPTVVVDIAHNPHKLGNLLQTLQRWPAQKRIALVAFSEGKDVTSMLSKLSQSMDEIWISSYQEGQGRRGCSLDDLRTTAEHLGILSRVKFSPSLQKAIEHIRQQITEKDLWVITGSTFLYAEVKACWR